jgi:hypothetical protein
VDLKTTDEGLLVTTTSNGVKHIIGTEVKTLSGDRESITITKPGLVLVEATNSVYNVEDTGNVGDALKFIRTKNNEGWEAISSTVLPGLVETMFKDDGPTGYLYIGGNFGNINGAPNTQNLAKIRLGSTGPWEPVGTGGLTDQYGAVRTMFKDDGPTGYLYIGGNFGKINNAENTANLAKIRIGSTGPWEPVGPVGSTGPDGTVETMFKDEITGYLYIGGYWNNELGNVENTQSLAKIRYGSTGPWEAVGPGGSTGPVGRVLTMFKDDGPTGYLYIGGYWTNELGNVPNTKFLAKIRLGSTGPWEPVGPVGSTGPVGVVNTMFKDDDPTGYLYIGGSWNNELGNVPNTQILAKIRLGSTGPWEAVGSTGPNIYVNTMFRDGPTGYLYIGGNWTNELGVPNTAHLAKLPFGSTGPWEAVGSTGPDVEVYTMFKDEISNYLYIGGSWDNELGGVPNTQRLARIVEETNIIVNDKIYNIPKIGDTLEFVYANPWVKLNYL